MLPRFLRPSICSFGLRTESLALALCGLISSWASAAPQSETIRPNAQPDVSLPAGHSLHGEAFDEGPRQAARLMGGTGKVKFSITTDKPHAQQFFDQGVGQLHGFWYWEAERSFRQVAAIDPECAMAYWGMAMANANNAQRALKFIREAAKRNKNTSRRESLYIEALNAYYDDWEKARQDEPAAKEQASESGSKAAQEDTAAKDRNKAADKKRKEDYLQKFEAITRDLPDDIEAKAFLAFYRWHWKDEVPIADPETVDALLQQVFAVEPMHPAHHYRIHLWDDPKPERAIDSAARCGQAAPAIAHMWHMPGHIYSKLHRYDDAVYQQEASARVDHLYMIRDRVMPYRIHNYAHNNEWLARDLLNVGRVRDAMNVARNLTEVPRHPKLNSPTDRGSAAWLGRERLRDAIVLYELWNDYIRLADTVYLDPGESESEWDKHIRWLGAAHLASGNRIQGREQLAKVQARLVNVRNEQDEAGTKAENQAREEKKDDADVEKAKGEARSAFDERAGALDKAIAHLNGLQAAAAGDHKTAVELFEKAGDLPKPHLARAYLRAGDKERAEKLAREAVDGAKNEIYPLASYIEVLYGLGKKDESRKAFDELRALAGSSDLNVPIFDRLAEVAAAFGYPLDWRLPRKEATDVGVRPPLESLGPFRWQSTPAVRWTMPSADGQFVSLADYAGKPVVVIFYLGYGCLHCAEQIQAFAPLTEEFNQAGIQLVAVSTDSVADLKKTIEAVKGSAGEGSGFPPRRAGSVQGSGADDQTSAVKGQASGSNATESAGFPFTLVSNDDLRLFKAYRCFDDFEQRPLHGTFLIDKDGLVRWQEIGAEPFKDAAFLLKEAKRLVGLPR